MKVGVRGRKMKVKRINDYTLQVMLQKDELTERGIGMMDLMGNQQQMEDFFQTVLDEVDPQHQFSMDQTVLFQVDLSQANLLQLATLPTKTSKNKPLKISPGSYKMNYGGTISIRMTSEATGLMQVNKLTMMPMRLPRP